MKSDYVLALVRAHCNGDRKEFHSIAKMIAAHDAGLQNGRFAREILKSLGAAPANALQPLPRDRDGDGELLEVRPVHMRLKDLVVDDTIQETLSVIKEEHRFMVPLREAGVCPISRILFDGPPGTGKTSAAGAIADALGLPFVVARHERILTSYMGNTSKNFGKVLDFARENHCVLLIDEFDSFGRARSEDAQAAATEMNRLLNVLLQLMDRHTGPSVLICVTNLPDAIDHALPRRFDLRVTFPMPSDEQRRELIQRTLGDEDGPWKGSHAEIVRECLREKKRRILQSLREGIGCETFA